MINVTLSLIGPITSELWWTMRPTSGGGYRVYCGHGVSRLLATLNAACRLRSQVRGTGRDGAKWAQQALDQLRAATADPHRIEGDPEQGTTMYAIIKVGPLGPCNV